MVVTNWMHVPIYRRWSKTKIISCPNLQFGVRELVGAQPVTLSFFPKFGSLMDINRSCIWHIFLDNSPLHFSLLRGVQGDSPCRVVGVQPKAALRQTARNWHEQEQFDFIPLFNNANETCVADFSSV